MPRKPTDAFGGWIFSKNGKIYKESGKLPEDKESQEKAVIEIFIEKFNESQDSEIGPNYVDLEESNHDFEILIDGKAVIVQVTEIVERDYVINKGASPTPGVTEGIIRFKVGAPGQQQVDVVKRNRALETAIKRKVEKRYSKPKKKFWLLVFTTDVGFYPEIRDAEFEPVLTPLDYARNYLRSVDAVFDQIWFINAYKCAPLLVWSGRDC